MTDSPLVLPDDEFNRQLVENVHPSDWRTPESSGRYHLVVIGAGTAGLVTAAGAAGLGAKVALIEKHLLGGDCLNVGCVPSKALIAASRQAAAVRRASEYGVRVAGNVEVDFPAVMERMRRLRAGISVHDSASRFRDLGVDVHFGSPRFNGSDTVQVGTRVLQFKKAVIATGARAATPSIPGIAETDHLTNETLFSLTELPRRLAVIGAGPIGCEMAQAFARFGSDVTLFETSDRILGREDPDASRIVQAALERDGVRILTECRVDSVTQSGAERRLLYTQSGSRQEVLADRILVGIGRAPNVEGLNLEGMQVRFDAKRGVHVDDKLRTTNPKIYAAGDICFPYKFTHSADFLARIVIRNALFLGRSKASASTIPWCTYTDPELAHVGLTERQADERGIAIRTFVQELSGVDRAVLDGEAEGFVKVHVRKETDRIVGATIVAAHAGDLIGEISLAMTNGLGLSKIGNTIHPYPTQAESIRKLGDAYARTRLTPLVQCLFRKWLSWTR